MSRAKDSNEKTYETLKKRFNEWWVYVRQHPLNLEDGSCHEFKITAGGVESDEDGDQYITASIKISKEETGF